MSISPPTDIVLDVARAADPTRYQVAAARLTKISAASSAEPFSEILDSANEVAAPAATAPRRHEPAGGAAKAYQGFEAMALSTFIQNAMPEDDNEVFGSGTAGSVWKSMLSEQIANQMAKAGGVGIAKELASRAMASLKAPAAGDVAPSLLANTERGFLRTIDPADGNSTDKTKI